MYFLVKILDAGRYCWEKSEIDFVVERSHIDDLVFRQKGYRATVRVSHAAKMVSVFSPVLKWFLKRFVLFGVPFVRELKFL